MKKQGFTLIELMVVIVIMGILAAVAVPKLFGMIAKSKASEVGPAAGTYVKLQQAYFSESNKIGGWGLIGYAAPGTSSAGANGAANTTNFSYTGGIATATASDGQGTQNVWNAASLVALNDCEKGQTWTVAAVVTSAEVSFNSAVPAGTGCAALTPTFDKIGK
jgi:prepilin-type N-terminal cleavage/methylation domain-containing protein